MTTTPTLPGTIPGLLRRCSPVTSEDGSGRGIIYAMPGYYRAYPDRWGVNWNYLLQPCDATRLHLDLTDPTGRAHAAWWLAGRAGASWALDCDGYRRWTLSGGEAPREGFCRSFEGVGAEVRHMRLRSHPPEYGLDAEDVPALDHLNPDDDRRLPDGSRWVDAEALRLVCLHVAGVAS